MSSPVGTGLRLLPYLLLVMPYAVAYDLYCRIRYGVWLHTIAGDAIKEVSASEP